MGRNLRLATAEALGTAVLVVGGCGTAIFATGILGGPSVGVLGVATAFGLSLMVMAYTIGPISGCHINPAVTVGMWVAGKTPSREVPWYVAGQLIGGLAGGLTLRAIWRLSSSGIGEGFASNGYGKHSPLGLDLASVALAEVVFTALLVLVVLGSTHVRYPVGFGGLAAGAALWLIHLVSIPIDNTSVNPARSLGVAPWAAETWPMEQVWAFLVFPLVGGALGALVWRFISAEPPAAAESATPDGDDEPDMTDDAAVGVA